MVLEGAGLFPTPTEAKKSDAELVVEEVGEGEGEGKNEAVYSTDEEEWDESLLPPRLAGS